MNYLPGDYVSTRFGPALVVGTGSGLVSFTLANGEGYTELDHQITLLYPGPNHGGSIADAARRAMAPVRKLVPHWDEMEREIAAAQTPATDLAALQSAMNRGDQAGIIAALGMDRLCGEVSP